MLVVDFGLLSRLGLDLMIGFIKNIHQVALSSDWLVMYSIVDENHVMTAGHVNRSLWLRLWVGNMSFMHVSYSAAAKKVSPTYIIWLHQSMKDSHTGWMKQHGSWTCASHIAIQWFSWWMVHHTYMISVHLSHWLDVCQNLLNNQNVWNRISQRLLLLVTVLVVS